MKIIAPKWAESMLDAMDAKASIDETLSFNKASQWLIVQLSKRDIPFAVHSMGAGVKRITTDTGKCPCCKKAL